MIAPTDTPLDLSLELYKRLFLIRTAEELIIKHYPENEMKTAMHMSMGQEAIAVGVCHALGPEGQIFASYRSHAAYIAKTNETDRFFAELYGRVSGTAKGKAGSMHLSAPEMGHLGSSAIVASCIPVAVGAAFANKRKGNGKIAGVFLGDGALDEGAFWESLNVACVMRVPLLFICEDNGLAVHTPRHFRQGYASITDVVRNFQCHVFESGSTDVEVIYRLAREAIERVRMAQRPAFLRLACYRYLEHVGIYRDFNIGYRSEAEFNEWYKQDPLILQRKRLLERGYPEEEIEKVESLIEQRVQNSIKQAKEVPSPGVDELYRGVFA